MLITCEIGVACVECTGINWSLPIEQICNGIMKFYPSENHNPESARILALVYDYIILIDFDPRHRPPQSSFMRG